MTLQEIKYFIALAKHLHFGRAAESCFVSQPTLSVAIQKLEGRLKTVLFERYKSTVKITPLGEKLLAQAHLVMREMEMLEQIAVHHQDPLQGVFKLGCIMTVGPYLLPHLIPNLKKIAADMPLELQEDFTENLKRKLLHGELDAIIVAEPFTLPNSLKKPLYEEKFVLLLPQGHRLSRRKVIKPEHLVDENMMLLGRGHCFRDQVLTVCPHCYLDPAIALPISPSTKDFVLDINRIYEVSNTLYSYP